MVDHIITAPIEQSIIVHAGPGAGKTFLIAQRIAYLLKSGLRKNSRLACITYTNTGVEEVIDKLIPTHFNHLPSDLYLDTIHSFLLEHVLRPYGHFLPEIPIDFKLTPPSGFVNKFITFEMRQLPEHKKQAFENIYCNPRGDYVCYRPIRVGNSTQYWMPTQQQMRSFKSKMHNDGFVDLPDILWFSLRLLRLYPAIAEPLACRFQIIIVDEFQDTTNLQVEILNILLATGKTFLFIVGDPNQSIFSYAGSQPSLFTNYCHDQRFNCSSCGETVHRLSVNRRSSNPIITFLNKYSTIPGGQVPGNQEWANHNHPVRLIIGGIDRATNLVLFRFRVLSYFFQLLEQNKIDRNLDDSFGIYAYENKTVAALNQISQGSNNLVAVSDNFEQIKLANKRLFRLLNGLIIAIKHKQFGEWSDAYASVNDVLTYHFYGTSPAFCKYDEPQIGLNRQLWGVAIWKIMQELPDNYQLSIYAWLQEVKTLVSTSISVVGGGNVRQKLGTLDCRRSVRQHADACSVNIALLSVLRPRLHTGNFRTIHGAKGTQREAVLVYASDADELEQWLLCNSIDQSETSRIGYVGFSRAKKLLCIACESVTRDQHRRLAQLPLSVVVLEDQPPLFPI